MIRVLLIAPYAEMRDLASEIAKEYPDIQLSSFVGNLDHALDFARTYPGQYFDVILSRGGTTRILAEHTCLPVIDIPLSVLDVLRTIKMAEMCQKRYAVVAHEAVCSVVRALCAILRMDIEIHAVPSENTLSSIFSTLKHEGIDVIVGDAIAVEAAQQNGMQGFLITTSSDEIRRTFDNVQQFFQNAAQMQALNSAIRASVEVSSDGLLVMDRNAQIIYSNPAFNDFASTNLFRYLSSLIPALSIQKKTHCLKLIDNTFFDINAASHTEGCTEYYSFKVFVSSRTSGLDASIIVENPDTVAKNINFFFTGSDYLAPVSQMLSLLCRSAAPIIIYGELGTEKSSLARMIHQGSSYSSDPFILIECDQITEKAWDSMVGNSSCSIYRSHCTLFLQNCHALSLSLQGKIESFFAASGANRIRLISSSTIDLSEMARNGSFFFPLHNRLTGMIINMPSLKERRSDIPTLASFCIAHYSTLLKKDIIGFDPDAIELLQAFDWPLNIGQFQNVIQQMIERYPGPYLTKKNVAAILAAIPHCSQSAAPFQLDKTSSLEDYERRIIDAVLHDENMNQASAAKRLGISRSTLWRKLRSSLSSSSN